ncbi:cytochrome c [Neisseria leonii]|uniref:Cytochrome c n=1 Tax=Neisseria leonii TaxID=2995413 RepID=A0A9X4E3Q3_9NEIS|nr:cytochrome c [Neisseria sp. 51.81]MDD9327406.1 cytochrome c [Neisseria sp. 51.81]
MTLRTLLAVTAATLTLAACGGNGSTAAQDKGPISENRTTAFKSMMPEFSAMGKMVKGEETYNVEKFKAAAAVFAENAQKPFEHFQNDTAGNGDALPAIWDKPAEFEAERTKFLNAVNELNNAAQTGSLDNIKAAYGEVGASCKACHDSFRRPK